MSLMNLGEHSRYWPWIKAIADHLTIPGTHIGLKMLTELQDDLTQDQFREQVKAMLEVMYGRTAEIAQRLRDERAGQIETDTLRTVSVDLAEELYLKQVADKFFYADFKGIEQQSRFVSLPLDEIYVDLKATPEEREDRLGDKERELRARLREADASERPEVLHALEALEVKGKDAKAGGEALSLDELLKAGGTVILLGGPGSGKTTVIKRLARSCALGVATIGRRFPRMPWCFPVLLPITEYAGERRPLLEYIEAVILARGGPPLLARYREYWGKGQVLLLLDGLDEVAETGQRIAAARAVDVALSGASANRLLVTSRRVGYAICRLTGPARHCLLTRFSPQDITTFVTQWHLAYEKAVHEDKADLAGARQAAESLNLELQKNASVALLATNPLMLTIISLIKHQHVVLPHRRVELYEVALNTLLRSWNLARSLAARPPREEPRIEQTREVWSRIAFWMHAEANRDIRRDRLQTKLVEILTHDFDKSEFDAIAIAESYLASAAETSGLLEARGPGTFAFIHQSFQEYLAALFLARPPSKAVGKIRSLCQDPRWTEVTRLGVGHLSIALGERETVGEIVDSLLQVDDPLEPFFGNSLRLALGCLADQVALRQTQVDAVLIAAADRIVHAPFERTRSSLVESLEAMTVAPGVEAQKKLLELVSVNNWRIRMEAVRLLGLASHYNADVLARLEAVLEKDQDDDVCAYAAWALWRQGRHDVKTISAIAHGLTSSFSRMNKLQDDDYLPALVKLLESPEAAIRYRAAQVLGNWGDQVTAVPALLKLLESPEADIRLKAAEVLAKWGDQVTAVPALLKLLESPEADIRLKAAEVLAKWGDQVTAVPALVKLLESPEAAIRSRAARVLAKWGNQATTVPALVKLLEDPETNTRFQAAEVLAKWGDQVTAVPALVKLLEDPETNTRFQAAEVLAKWGYQATAVSALVKLLEDSQAYVRRQAAEVLGKWERQATAVPALVKLLEDSLAEIRLQAAEVLGNWGDQATAVPVLVKLLEAPQAYIRSQTVEVLGKWGHQATVLSALVKVLEDPQAGIRSRAAGVLGKWGYNEPGLMGFVLTKLTGKAEPAILSLCQRTSSRSSNHGGQGNEVRTDLAKLLQAQSGDSLLVEQLRGILHGWAWRTLATTA